VVTKELINGMSNVRKGKSAIVLGITALSFWIIQYFIKLDNAITISVVFLCIIIGIILAISYTSEDQDQGMNLFQKMGLAINFAVIIIMILSQIIVRISG